MANRISRIRLHCVGLVSGLIFLAAGSLFGQETQPSKCRTIIFKTSLKTAESMQRKITPGLTFHIHSLGSGWDFSLNDSHNQDYIYPVNPPLRFNPLQFLGPAYTADAYQSLDYDHKAHFVLEEPAYDLLQPFVEYALWPYEVPNTDSEAVYNAYYSAVSKTETGTVKIETIKYMMIDHAIQSATFKVSITAPVEFRFLPSLHPFSSSCT